MKPPSKESAERKLQESLDIQYRDGRLPRKVKVKKETQTIFSVKSEE